jgi:predicted flap endonuclease-1-like 5' DNA nuclease
MTDLAYFNFWPIIFAIFTGLLTGWWMWAGVDQARHDFQAELEGVSVDAVNEQPVGFVESAPDRDAAVLAKALTPAAPVALPAISLLKEQPKATVPQVKPRRIAKEKAVPRLTAIGIPASVGPANDLLQIKGVGPKLNALLNTLGVSRFDQIAAWKAKDISKVDEKLGAFQGRIIRDNWIDQAGLLATGKISTFESRYGTLDSENQ